MRRVSIEAMIPRAIREAVFAAASLYDVLGRRNKVRLYWRAHQLCRVEVHGLCWPYDMPLLTSDAMDVAVTLQNAGFDTVLGAQVRSHRVPVVYRTADAEEAEERRMFKPVWVWEANRVAV